MKVITICGSLKYREQMMQITESMALQGNCMLGIILPTRSDSTYTEEEIRLLGEIHKQKIKLSDAILVVNVDNYIGKVRKVK